MASRFRSPGQTATAFSVSQELFEAMEQARKKLGMDRSNFIRMALAKEIHRIEAGLNGTEPLVLAERPVPYDIAPRKRGPKGRKKHESDVPEVQISDSSPR